MQLLILTDSVALPRTSPEQVGLHSTWPYRLRELVNFEFIQASIGGATSNDLLNQTFYYKSIKPQVVIVQCGVVDLAPRAFHPFELDLLRKFKLTKVFLNRIRKSKTMITRIRNFRKTTYVSPKKFKRNLKSFKELFGKSLYWITVPAQLDGYDKAVPGILDNIRKYNELIRMEVGENTIDIESFSLTEVMSDFHHLNSEGHRKLALKIIQRLKDNHVIK